MLTIYIFLDPVTNVKTQGNVWLQEGEMLELQVLHNELIHNVMCINCILKQMLLFS